MISKPLAVGLLAAACVTAAAGGAYVAVRQNTVTPDPIAAPAPFNLSLAFSAIRVASLLGQLQVYSEG